MMNKPCARSVFQFGMLQYFFTMAFETYTHAIHGQFSLPPQDALLRQSLIAVSGRLIAIGAGNHIHLYDSHDVSNVSGVLGTGSCKFRFLCSFPIMDINDSVTVTSLLFLRGGHLALSGLCAKGTGKYHFTNFPKNLQLWNTKKIQRHFTVNVSVLIL